MSGCRSLNSWQLVICLISVDPVNRLVDKDFNLMGAYAYLIQGFM